MKRLLLLLAVLAGCSGGDSGKEEFQFTFNPPDTARFTCSIVGERGGRSAQSQTVDSNLSFNRYIMTANEQGFEIVSHTDSTRLIRQGETVDDPVLKLFASAVITRQIDTAGYSTSVTGYDEVFKKIDSALDPQIATAVRQRLNPGALEQKEIEEWNESFAPLVGKAFEIGEYSYELVDLGMIGGQSLSYYSATVLRDTVRIDGALCGHLSIIGETCPDDLAEKLELPRQDILDAFDLTDSVAEALALNPIGSGMFSEKVLELETMLMHSDRSGRELRNTAPGPDGTPQTRVIFETQDRQYSYLQ